MFYDEKMKGEFYNELYVEKVVVEDFESIKNGTYHLENIDENLAFFNQDNEHTKELFEKVFEKTLTNDLRKNKEIVEDFSKNQAILGKDKFIPKFETDPLFDKRIEIKTEILEDYIVDLGRLENQAIGYDELNQATDEKISMIDRCRNIDQINYVLNKYGIKSELEEVKENPLIEKVESKIAERTQKVVELEKLTAERTKEFQESQASIKDEMKVEHIEEAQFIDENQLVLYQKKVAGEVDLNELPEGSKEKELYKEIFGDQAEAYANSSSFIPDEDLAEKFPSVHIRRETEIGDSYTFVTFSNGNSANDEIQSKMATLEYELEEHYVSFEALIEENKVDFKECIDELEEELSTNKRQVQNLNELKERFSKGHIEQDNDLSL